MQNINIPKKWQFQARAYPWLLAGLITTVHASLFNIIQVSIFPFMAEISQQFNVPINFIKFVSVLENGFLVGSIAILNISIRRYSIHRCVVYGSFFVFIPNLIIGLVSNFWVFSACRIVQAVGYGFVLPTSISLTNYLVRDNKEEYGLTVCNVVSQASTIIGVYLGKHLIQKNTFQLQVVIFSGIGIGYSVLFAIFLPFPTKTVKSAKYNPIGVPLACIGFVSFGTGVAFLVMQGLKYQLEIAQIIMATGFLFIVAFFVYNFKFCKKDLSISIQVFNKNSRHFMVGFCINFLIMFIIQAFDSQIWRDYFNVNSGQITFLMNLNKFLIIPLIPLIVLIVKRIVVRQIATYNAVLMLVLCILLMINRKIFQSVILQEICNTTIVFIVQLNLTMGQMYNLRHSPKQFVPPTGTYLFVGVRGGVLLQQMCTYYILDLFEVPDERVIIMYVFCALLSLYGLLLVKDLGIFDFEYGKVGFSQNLVSQCETYDTLTKRMIDAGVDARTSFLRDSQGMQTGQTNTQQVQSFIEKVNVNRIQKNFQTVSFNDKGKKYKKAAPVIAQEDDSTLG